MLQNAALTAPSKIRGRFLIPLRRVKPPQRRLQPGMAALQKDRCVENRGSRHRNATAPRLDFHGSRVGHRPMDTPEGRGSILAHVRNYGFVTR